MKLKRFGWLFWVTVAFWVLHLPPAYGDLTDEVNKVMPAQLKDEGFHPYLILGGGYDSNIYLTQDNTQSDFITAILPGIKYFSEGPTNKLSERTTYKVDLDFRIGSYLYAENSGNNYIGYRGSLDTFYPFTPNWTVKLLDNLERSRNTVSGYSLSTPTGPVSTANYNVGGNLFIQNIFQPEIEFKFAQDSFVSLYYRNQIYRVDETTPATEDSTANTISPRLDYWFNIHHGVSFDYAYINAKFERSPDWIGNLMAGRYLYRLNPRTTITGEFQYQLFDYAFSIPDFSLSVPSIYLEHAFSPTLTGRARFGWFWQQYSGDTPPNTDGLNGPVFLLGITQKDQKTTYSLTVEGGYRFDYFTASNQGFSKYYEGRAGVSYQLTQRLSVGLIGTASRDEYQSPQDTQYNYRLLGNISYQPLKWLTISLGGGNYSRNSDIDGNSYRDNRITLVLTGTY
jgi:hypothetical protein